MNKWLSAFLFACGIVAACFTIAAIVSAQVLFLGVWAFAALAVELLVLITVMKANGV